MQILINAIDKKFRELDKDFLFDFITELLRSTLTKELISFHREANIPEFKKEFKKTDLEKNRTYILWLNSCRIHNKYLVLSFSSNLDWISYEQIKRIADETSLKLTSSTREESTVLTVDTFLPQFSKASFYQSGGVLEKNGNTWMCNSQLVAEKELSFNKAVFME